MKRTHLILLSLFLILASSCKNKELIAPGDTLEEAYEKAIALFEKEQYAEAARALETVISIGRGSDQARQAQYHLAESYFREESFLLAASEFERYTLLYPDSERKEEVEFKIALCYFEISPRHKLDQAYTAKAIENFRLFLSRYPRSERAEEAAAHIDDLRLKLARKLYDAAVFYKRIKSYEASAIYFGLVIDQYPETPLAELALMERIETYKLYADNSIASKQRERYELALESYQTYLQLFPRGENRSKVETLRDEVLEALNELAGDGSTQNGAASGGSGSMSQGGSSSADRDRN